MNDRLLRTLLRGHFHVASFKTADAYKSVIRNPVPTGLYSVPYMTRRVRLFGTPPSAFTIFIIPHSIRREFCCALWAWKNKPTKWKRASRALSRTHRIGDDVVMRAYRVIDMIEFRIHDLFPP